QILHLLYPSSPTRDDRRAISNSSPEPFGPPRFRKNRHGALRSSARRRAELFRPNDRSRLGEFRVRRQKVAREGKRRLRHPARVRRFADCIRFFGKAPASKTKTRQRWPQDRQSTPLWATRAKDQQPDNPRK